MLCYLLQHCFGRHCPFCSNCLNKAFLFEFHVKKRFITCYELSRFLNDLGLLFILALSQISESLIFLVRLRWLFLNRSPGTAVSPRLAQMSSFYTCGWRLSLKWVQCSGGIISLLSPFYLLFLLHLLSCFFKRHNIRRNNYSKPEW